MSCVKINAQTTCWKKLVQNHFMIYELYSLDPAQWPSNFADLVYSIYYIATKIYQPPPSPISLLCLLKWINFKRHCLSHQAWSSDMCICETYPISACCSPHHLLSQVALKFRSGLQTRQIAAFCSSLGVGEEICLLFTIRKGSRCHLKTVTCS